VCDLILYGMIVYLVKFFVVALLLLISAAYLVNKEYRHRDSVTNGLSK